MQEPKALLLFIPAMFVLDLAPAYITSVLPTYGVFTTSTMEPIIIKEPLIFNTPVTHYFHIDKINTDRCFYGVVAKLGNNISYSCEKNILSNDGIYNRTNKSDPRLVKGL